ncbi:N-acetylmuramoyl-L-alanine amidase [Streptomyces sp. NPDC088707]|uniref:N-acetylmuramoyl-L-alanine amidase n=1 Tax=Streptomyces sp. NPDC088707 TaxID=3365871 RepID=UPI00380BDCE3
MKVHYLGTAYTSRPHEQCAAYVRQIRASHLANRKEGYVDVAYNFLVCEHRGVFEGRGVHKRTGANGTAALNTQDYAVCALLGSSGLTKPSDDMLHGIRDAIEELREHGGAGKWVGGHKDGHPTSCPGDALYDWVQRGAPRPAVTPPPPASGSGSGGKPVVDLSRLIAAAKADPPKRGTPVSYYGVKTVESALVAEGLLAREVADGHYGTATVLAYAAWQRRCGYKGGDADGKPGPASLEKLAKKRGFTVAP